MPKAPKIVFFILAFIATPSLAEIIKIRTNNQVFRIEKQIILEGPEGYLKSALREKQLLTTRQKDGSIFVNVDARAMRIALNFIKHGILENIPSSPIIQNELAFLLPELHGSFKKEIAKKIWHCGAYCYSGEKEHWTQQGFLIATDMDIFSAWQKLNQACRAKTLNQKTYATLTKNFVALNKDVGSSAPSMKDVCIKRRP